jgi:hypothetical protein
MVVGAVAVARRVPAGAYALGVLLAVGIQGAGLGLPTAWLAVGFGAAMWFIGGLGHGTKNVLARTLIPRACRTASTGGRSPPTTVCATAPSWSRWPPAGCWWPPSAGGRRSRSPARSR